MELLQITLLGGVLALDATAVGQFMLSRPLIAGTLAGWVLGDAGLGLLVGAILELYLLVSFPSGGSRFPEGATATVVAVASAAVAAGPGPVALGVAMGLVWGHLGGMSITVQRKLNGRLIPEPSDESVEPRRIAMAQITAIAMDFGRGASLTLAGVLVGRRVVAGLGLAWPLASEATTALLLMGAAVSLGILLRSLGGFRKRRLLFVTGLALGLVGARLL